MKNAVDFAKIIWDYHHVNQTVVKSDCLLVLGSYDITPADRAVDLFFAGFAPFIIFSGGKGRHTENFSKSEAEVFAGVALARGVPKDKIILETKSTNTGDNIQFVKNLITEKKLDIKSFICVSKPYMERRVYATFKKVWPEMKFVVTSPEITFKEYIKSFPLDQVINIIVADLQRIQIYPEMGYQITQEMPNKVIQAYHELVKLGYNRELLKT